MQDAISRNDGNWRLKQDNNNIENIPDYILENDEKLKK